MFQAFVCLLYPRFRSRGLTVKTVHTHKKQSVVHRCIHPMQCTNTKPLSITKSEMKTCQHTSRHIKTYQDIGCENCLQFPASICSEMARCLNPIYSSFIIHLISETYSPWVPPCLVKIQFGENWMDQNPDARENPKVSAKCMLNSLKYAGWPFTSYRYL